ncbi:MAG: hypothetical protein BWY25_02619 [Chloroflexi bacterium ADurb.Bin222]|nr:MAG: hypothetical protein BWY25_02619 [Chloroflexi bacterium ADurb.Bin222]
MFSGWNTNPDMPRILRQFSTQWKNYSGVAAGPVLVGGERISAFSPLTHLTGMR